MINAIAIDDEPPALKVIETFCNKVDFIDLQKTFVAPSEAAKHLRKFPVDLVFLDIHMPSISGIDFFKTIPQASMVIFTTAYSDYAVEGFNLNAIDYLLKPITFRRFQQAVNKAKEFYNYQHNKNSQELKYLFVRADYRLVKLSINSILFIEGLDDYLKIHLDNDKPVVTRMTLKSILEKLPTSEFIRVHRSYLVPFSRIESIRNKTILIAGEEIPIGSSYEDDILKRLNK